MTLQNMQSITRKDHLLVKNAKTGTLVELIVDYIGEVFIYAFIGTERTKFNRRTGKGEKTPYSVVAWGEVAIEEYRSKQLYELTNADLDYTRFKIPDEKRASVEDGSIIETAELVATRVKFHVSNNDWDGALRILQNCRDEHFNRIEELWKAAKSNGLSAPLTLLGLSVRITNAIERCGCRTIFDLCVMDGGALMLASGVGPDSYDAIRKRLDEFGFDHRMEPLKEWRKTK